MTVAQFAQFFGRLGHRLINVGGAWWYSPHPFVYSSLPFHRPVDVSPGDVASIFRRRLAAVVRNATAHGSNGGIFLCSRRNYDESSLQHNARNRLRRAIENCSVEQVSPSFLATGGYSLFEDTLRRQNRGAGLMTETWWRRYCGVSATTPAVEAWASFVDGRLAALLFGASVENHFTFLLQCSSTSYLRYSPNNALIFTVTRTQLSKPDTQAVCYGLKSVEETSTLDHFKSTMGFELVPVGFDVILNPLLDLSLSCGGRRVIEWIAGRWHESDFWRKAHSFLQTLERKAAA